MTGFSYKNQTQSRSINKQHQIFNCILRICILPACPYSSTRCIIKLFVRGSHFCIDLETQNPIPSNHSFLILKNGFHSELILKITLSNRPTNMTSTACTIHKVKQVMECGCTSGYVAENDCKASTNQLQLDPRRLSAGYWWGQPSILTANSQKEIAGHKNSASLHLNFQKLKDSETSIRWGILELEGRSTKKPQHSNRHVSL